MLVFVLAGTDLGRLGRFASSGSGGISETIYYMIVLRFVQLVTVVEAGFLVLVFRYTE